MQYTLSVVSLRDGRNVLSEVCLCRCVGMDGTAVGKDRTQSEVESGVVNRCNLSGGPSVRKCKYSCCGVR